jgi:hypothetical protein
MEPEVYQRLLANPFLALFGLIAWIGGLNALVVRQVAGAMSGAFAIALALLILFLPRLLHYHCLDCGATGPLRRWRQHACAAVLARAESGRRRRLRGVTPPWQVVVWFWVLAILAVAIAELRAPAG